MKLLTIIIFSGNRLYISGLLQDISNINQKHLNVRIIDWAESETILKEKKKVYLKFKKKIKNYKVYFQKNSPEHKDKERKEIINKFKSKYILIIGDDDRICSKNFDKLFKFLKLNYSGITLSFNNFKKNEDLNKYYLQKKNISIEDFNILRDVNRMGFQSCQLIKTDLINKIFNKERKNLLLTKFPMNFIIFRIIKEFGNWKMVNLKCIFNRLNLDFYLKHEQYLDRLNSEYLGYFTPIKENFKNLGEHELNKIYKVIFFENIISWLFLSIKYCGKKKTYNKIKNSRKIINEPFIVKLVLIFIYVCPIFLLEILRLFRKIFKIIVNPK
jgi:hypothetical protein